MVICFVDIINSLIASGIFTAIVYLIHKVRQNKKDRQSHED
jgi:hypothetical protein